MKYFRRINVMIVIVACVIGLASRQVESKSGPPSHIKHSGIRIAENKETPPKKPRQDIYDQALLPITSKELKRNLQQATKDRNAVAAEQLIRRASVQGHLLAAFNTLKELKSLQPENAVILAAYCFAFDFVDGQYHTKTYQRFSGEDYIDYDETLKKAYIQDPQLWLTYVVEGYKLIDKPGEDERGFVLLKKAVELAPNVATTHFWLGFAFTVCKTSFMSYEKAVAEYQRALELSPVFSPAARQLLFIHCFALPDKAKAKANRAKYLSLLPPNYEMSAKTKTFLKECAEKIDS